MIIINCERNNNNNIVPEIFSGKWAIKIRNSIIIDINTPTSIVNTIDDISNYDFDIVRILNNNNINFFYLSDFPNGIKDEVFDLYPYIKKNDFVLPDTIDINKLSRLKYEFFIMVKSNTTHVWNIAELYYKTINYYASNGADDTVKNLIDIGYSYDVNLALNNQYNKTNTSSCGCSNTSTTTPITQQYGNTGISNYTNYPSTLQYNSLFGSSNCSTPDISPNCNALMEYINRITLIRDQMFIDIDGFWNTWLYPDLVNWLIIYMQSLLDGNYSLNWSNDLSGVSQVSYVSCSSTTNQVHIQNQTMVKNIIDALILIRDRQTSLKYNFTIEQMKVLSGIWDYLIWS